MKGMWSVEASRQPRIKPCYWKSSMSRLLKLKMTLSGTHLSQFHSEEKMNYPVSRWAMGPWGDIRPRNDGTAGSPAAM
jgi:hypothetical protein